MSGTLKPNWFSRDTKVVARELLGKLLCRRLPNGEVIRLTINEVEAYVGPHDAASHAFNNRRTKRTEVMFGEAGTIYIYLIYGMHYMLNIVTESVDYPAAILIRGVGDFDGPGKLTKILEIDKDLNNHSLSERLGLWIEDSVLVPDEKILATPRIGINYAAEPWKSALLRYIVK